MKDKLKKIKFGTKAETLQQLRSAYSSLGIPELVFFTIKQWRSDAASIVDQIKKTLNKVLVVRSSALAEDSYACSNAGAFLSVLGVENSDPSLKDAIEQVINSMPGEDNDQVLVQNQVEDIAVSGVIFTRCPDDGAPYYILNYDDESGTTDKVTGGIGASKTIHIFRKIEIQDLRSPRIRQMMNLALQLEEIFASDCIDIEFGLDNKGQVHLFQVRPIGGIERWTGQAERLVASNFDFVESFFVEQSSAKPGVFGKQAIFGVMPDWNPAEMIGVVPRPLAASLYRELITKNVWRLAREYMGYRPVQGELMVIAAGRPYIDVRQSFNSFLPPGLPDATYEKLVNAWLAYLHDNPELHDKVEFGIAKTCMDFDFKATWQKRYPGLLSQNEMAMYEKALAKLTLNCLQPENSLAKAEADIALLEQRQQTRNLNPGKLEHKLPWINYLCEETARYGTFPFSILARHAFIAESLLRSAVSRGAIEETRVSLLRNSIVTIASSLAEELGEVLRGERDKSDFLVKYGHLRPSSYDILSPRYDNRSDIFQGETQASGQRIEHTFQLNAQEKSNLGSLMREHGFSLITADGLLDYVSRAIAGREYAKFIFTRNLSDIIEIIAAFAEDLSFTRDEISYLNVQVLLEQSVTGFLEPVREHLYNHISHNQRLFELAQSLRLPYLITSPRDVKIVPQHRSAPNFVSFEQIIAPVVYLSTTTTAEELTGCIVCIENADPGFDWIFSRAIGGLVTKFGGANSHMAVRCAEYSLPAAIGCGEKLFDAVVNASMVKLDPVSKILQAVDFKEL